MNYEEFLEYIKGNLAKVMEHREHICKDKSENEPREDRKQEETGNSYEVELHKIIKNNGITLDGLTIRKTGECIGPNIYLNSYFESYQMGKPLSVIMEEIISCYESAKEEKMFEIEDIRDFSAVKDKIVLRLVNYEKNKEQLKNCPYKKYLDLAVTFRYVAGKDPVGIASSLISNTEFNMWNIQLEELYQIALFNTMREFPWQMNSLAKVISDCLKDRFPEILPDEVYADVDKIRNKEDGVSMYVLTNDTGINGATCILYDNVIKHFAKVQESNIFILPSSIHEVMLVPENTETEPEFLISLVVEANQSAVGLIDLLSDNIYYYDREKDQIYIYASNIH